MTNDQENRTRANTDRTHTRGHMGRRVARAVRAMPRPCACSGQLLGRLLTYAADEARSLGLGGAERHIQRAIRLMPQAHRSGCLHQPEQG